jgi:nucleoside-diphosphate-sugar epimerase
MKKKAIVLGAGGFIGHHLAKSLVNEGFWVRGVDQKKPRYEETDCQDFLVGDLTDPLFCAEAFDMYFDEVYQLAADMGGAGYIFTGENDADVMYNSALINLNVANAVYRRNIKRVFYSSSACMYPEHNQLDPENPKCDEDSAYPADPDSEYGWEKLFSERLFLAYGRNKGIEPRVALYHNIFGPLGSWNDGREKAPAALCRKVAEVESGGVIDLWGDGLQTRSFLFIDDCVEATKRLTRSNWEGPVNIGSEEMIAINDLAYLIASIAGKQIEINNIAGPVGVRGRNSDNNLIKEKLSWSPQFDLKLGLEKTYPWIFNQVLSNE